MVEVSVHVHAIYKWTSHMQVFTITGEFTLHVHASEH